MVDRVQLTKYESTALGGDDADTLPYPAPINAQEDAIEVAGVYLQDVSNRDETVLIDRSGDDMQFTDVNNAGGVTLSQLVRSVSKVGTPVNNELAVWTGDGTVEGESELTYDGTVLTVSGNLACTKAAVAGPITLTEVAAADADVAGKGQVWVKDNTPNDLYFTDDTGVDHLVSLTEANYARLPGRSGGQTLNGGTEASQDLTLVSTASSTRGHIYLGAAQTSAFDETNGRLGVGITAPDTLIHVATGDSGATPGFNSLLTLEAASSWVGLQLLTSNTGTCAIYFGDGDSEDGARLQYEHSADAYRFYIGNQQRMVINSTYIWCDEPLYLGASSHIIAKDGDDLTFKDTNNSTPVTLSTLVAGVAGTGTPANNQIAVWTDASTIEGASELTFDGTTFKVQTASLGAVTPSTAADELVLENDGNAGLTILSSRTTVSALAFGDQDDTYRGAVEYDNNNNRMRFYVNDDYAVYIDSARKVGIGTVPDTLLHMTGQTPILYVADNQTGASALSRTMSGVQLSSVGMTIPLKYTPAIKFMSTDPALTTENPKLCAAIVGRATEEYGLDTDGGMAIDFAVTADNPGTTNVPAIGMSLTSTGLGVGIATPSYPLDVRSAADAYGISHSDGTHTLSTWVGSGAVWIGAVTSHLLGFGASGGTDLAIDTSGQVGININSPDTLLHVHAATAGTVSPLAGTVLTVENSTTAYISLLTPNSATSGILFGDPEGNDAGQIKYDHSTNTLSLGEGGFPRMYIESGRVGINESTPQGKLHIKSAGVGTISPPTEGSQLVLENSGDCGLTIYSGATSSGSIVFADAADDLVSALQYDHNDNQLEFYVNNGYRAYMTSTYFRVNNVALQIDDASTYIDRDGGSNMTFTDAVTGTKSLAELAAGDVAASGTPVDNQLAVWTNATTIEGTSSLTFDGTTFGVQSSESWPQVSVGTASHGTDVFLHTGSATNGYAELGFATVVGSTYTGEWYMGAYSTGHSTRAGRFYLLHYRNVAGTIIQTFPLAVDDDDNVGIGTISPNANLHIKSTGDAGVWLEADTDNVGENDNPYLKLSQDNATIVGGIGLVGGTDVTAWGDTATGALDNALVISNEYVGGTGYGDIQFATETVVRLTITDTGYVGIGTTSPDTTLHVWKATAGSVSPLANTVLTVENSTTAYLSFLTPNTATSGILFGDPEDNDVGSITYNHSSNVLSFKDGTTGTKTLAELAASSGGVSASGTPVNNQIAVWTDSSTIEGSSELTWNATTLRIDNGNSAVTPDVDQDDLFIESAGHTGITIGSGTSSYGTLCFADSGHDEAARIMYAHGYQAYWILAENVQIMTWEYAPTVGGQLGLTKDFPAAKLHVSGGTAIGTELVIFDQNDIDKPFIDFQGTAATNTTNTISNYTTSGACQGHLQIEVNGTKYWIPFYANPS